MNCGKVLSCVVVYDDSFHQFANQWPSSTASEKGHTRSSRDLWWRWKAPFWSSLSDPTGTNMNRCKSTIRKVIIKAGFFASLYFIIYYLDTHRWKWGKHVNKKQGHSCSLLYRPPLLFLIVSIRFFFFPFAGISRPLPSIYSRLVCVWLCLFPLLKSVASWESRDNSNPNRKFRPNIQIVL